MITPRYIGLNEYIKNEFHLSLYIMWLLKFFNYIGGSHYVSFGKNVLNFFLCIYKVIDMHKHVCKHNF